MPLLPCKGLLQLIMGLNDRYQRALIYRPGSSLDCLFPEQTRSVSRPRNVLRRRERSDLIPD